MLVISTTIPCTVKSDCCGCIHGYFSGSPTDPEAFWIFQCNECGTPVGTGLERYVSSPSHDWKTCNCLACHYRKLNEDFYGPAREYRADAERGGEERG